MKLSIGKKIGIGLVGMTLIIVIIAGINIWQFKKAEEVTLRIVNLRSPTLQYCKTILNGFNHALASIRGYMLLGDEKFVVEHNKNWEQEILIPMAELTKFSKSWTDSQDISRLMKISQSIAELKTIHDQIKSIANTEENIPSKQLLNDRAAPLSSLMDHFVSSIIETEERMPATEERKKLMRAFSDIRGTLAMGAAQIRAYVDTGDISHKETFEELWKENDYQFKQMIQKKKLLDSEQANNFERLWEAREEYSHLPAKIFRLREQKNWNQANYLLTIKALPLVQQLEEMLRQLVINHQMLLEKDGEYMTFVISRLTMIELLLIAVGVLVCIFFGTVVIKNLKGDLRNTLKLAEKAKKSANLFSKNATEQNRAVDDIAASLEELISSIQDVAQNANNVSNNAHQSAEEAKNGGIAVQKSVKSMELISESSQKIMEIIDMISDIADQTNLLALNASIEAARAGEHGKGFAVVADSVGKLADRSGQAAKEISTLIHESRARVEEGETLSKNAGETLQTIIEHVEITASMIEQISAATEEQAATSNAINDGINQISIATDQNANSSEALIISAKNMVEMIHSILTGKVNQKLSNKKKKKVRSQKKEKVMELESNLEGFEEQEEAEFAEDLINSQVIPAALHENNQEESRAIPITRSIKQTSSTREKEDYLDW